MYDALFFDFDIHCENSIINSLNYGDFQGRNADALALYFGEDPARCPFEQGMFATASELYPFLCLQRRRIELHHFLNNLELQ